jgi:hypothetical protein
VQGACVEVGSYWAAAAMPISAHCCCSHACSCRHPAQRQTQAHKGSTQQAGRQAGRQAGGQHSLGHTHQCGRERGPGCKGGDGHRCRSTSR